MKLVLYNWYSRSPVREDRARLTAMASARQIAYVGLAAGQRSVTFLLDPTLCVCKVADPARDRYLYHFLNTSNTGLATLKLAGNVLKLPARRANIF